MKRWEKGRKRKIRKAASGLEIEWGGNSPFRKTVVWGGKKVDDRWETSSDSNKSACVSG